MSEHLSGIVKQFAYYKMLGEKTFLQVPDDKLFWQYNEECNSMATIVKHLWGNMVSRWTDLLTSDGEKEWRNRDAEFENDIVSRAEMISLWNQGWDTLFASLQDLTDQDLDKIIYIRNQGHTLMEALYRQLAHYSYHVGQLVYIGKMCAKQWNSLSIPRGGSSAYNRDKFSSEKRREHFTDEFLLNNKQEQ